MVVTQLVERSLLSPEVCRSKLVIGKHLHRTVLSTVMKRVVILALKKIMKTFWCLLFPASFWIFLIFCEKQSSNDEMTEMSSVPMNNYHLGMYGVWLICHCNYLASCHCTNFSVHDNTETSSGATIAQWICLRLPSWCPRFESQSHNLRFYRCIFKLCRVKKTKINKTDTGSRVCGNYIMIFRDW